VLREWQRNDSIRRESNLMIKRGEVIDVKLVMFEDNENVVEEMVYKDKGNQRKREK
jgi:hypothetical protein